MKPLSAWRSMAVLRHPAKPTRPVAPPKKAPETRLQAWMWQGGTWGAFALATVIMLAILIAGLVAINLPFLTASRAHSAIESIDEDKLTRSLELIRSDPDATRQFKELIGDHEARIKEIAKDPRGSLAALSKSSQGVGPLAGVSLIIDAPPNIAPHAKAAVEAHGARVFEAKDCLRTCSVLTWTPPRGWYLYGRGQPDETKALEGWIVVALSQARAPADDASPAALTLSMSTAAEGTRALLNETLTSTIHFCFVLVAWVMALASGLLGFQWDSERAKGRLEPWVMTHHSPWVMYGSQLRTMVFWGTGSFGVLLVLAALWRLPVSWSFLFGLWLCVPPAIIMVGLWSLFATVLFHHANGRMFARIALSPVTLGIAWTIRAMMLLGAMKLAQPIQARALLDGMNHSGVSLMMLSVALWMLGAALAWLVHWRIGPRREGLRKTL